MAVEAVEGERGRYLSRRGFMCAAVSVEVLLRKEQASSSARTCLHILSGSGSRAKKGEEMGKHTA